MHIAICDDQNEVLEAIKDMLEASEFPEACHIAAFSDEKAFLAHMQSNPADVAIIDIMLGNGANGVEVAKQVNKNCPHTAVIFISGSTKFAEELYETKHMHFLKKPLKSDKLAKVITKVAEINSPKIVTIMQKNIVRKINQDDILMVESEGRIIKIYAFSKHGESVEHGAIAGGGLEIIEHVAKLSDFEKLLSPGIFVRCHQSYVINMNHITEVERTKVILAHGIGSTCISAPISRRYVTEVKTKMLRMMGGLL